MRRCGHRRWRMGERRARGGSGAAQDRRDPGSRAGSACIEEAQARVTSRSAKALISWSSGKDSAFALHEVRRGGEFEVVGALTTVTETFGRVSIHGVRQEILRAQLDAAALPARIVPIPYPCPNEIYEARIGEAVDGAV